MLLKERERDRALPEVIREAEAHDFPDGYMLIAVLIGYVSLGNERPADDAGDRGSLIEPDSVAGEDAGALLPDEGPVREAFVNRFVNLVIGRVRGREPVPAPRSGVFRETAFLSVRE